MSLRCSVSSAQARRQFTAIACFSLRSRWRRGRGFLLQMNGILAGRAVRCPPILDRRARSDVTCLTVGTGFCTKTAHLQGKRAAEPRKEPAISGKAGMPVRPGALLVFEPNLPAWGNDLVSRAWRWRSFLPLDEFRRATRGQFHRWFLRSPDRQLLRHP